MVPGFREGSRSGLVDLQTLSPENICLVIEKNEKYHSHLCDCSSSKFAGRDKGYHGGSRKKKKASYSPLMHIRFGS
jgi:hypothetical protein